MGTYQIEHFTQQDIQKRGSVQRRSLAFSLLSWPSRPWQVAAECLCKKNIHASQCDSTASMTVSRTEEEILISRRVIAGRRASVQSQSDQRNVGLGNTDGKRSEKYGRIRLLNWTLELETRNTS